MLKASEPPRLVCTRPTCGFVFYLDPKIAVGTVIRMPDDRIVLVRRAIEPGYGKWVFPGGYVDRGEEITLAAIREAREEVGLEVRIDRLINIYSYAGRAPIVVVYAATWLSGELVVDDEGLEAQTVRGQRHPVGRARLPQHTGRAAGTISRNDELRTEYFVPPASGHRDVFGQIHVLNRVKQRHAFGQRALERLAAGDQAHPAGALVDHRGADRFLQIALRRPRRRPN